MDLAQRGVRSESEHPTVQAKQEFFWGLFVLFLQQGEAGIHELHTNEANLVEEGFPIVRGSRRSGLRDGVSKVIACEAERFFGQFHTRLQRQLLTGQRVVAFDVLFEFMEQALDPRVRFIRAERRWWLNRRDSLLFGAHVSWHMRKSPVELKAEVYCPSVSTVCQDFCGHIEILSVEADVSLQNADFIELMKSRLADGLTDYKKLRCLSAETQASVMVVKRNIENVCRLIRAAGGDCIVPWRERT